MRPAAEDGAGCAAAAAAGGGRGRGGAWDEGRLEMVGCTGMPGGRRCAGPRAEAGVFKAKPRGLDGAELAAGLAKSRSRGLAAAVRPGPATPDELEAEAE